MEKIKLKERWRYIISFIATVLRRILRTISLKKFFNRKKNGIMYLEIPTQFKSQTEKEKFLEVTMEKLEKIIKI
jgi:hypothetical protein